MSQLLTAKQCRASRSLLKWNLQDLAARCNIPAKRIDSFEKGILHLYQNENIEIMNILKKNGVEFLSDFEVRLKKDADNKDKSPVYVGSVGISDPNVADPKQEGDDRVHVATDHYVGPDRRNIDYDSPDRPARRQTDQPKKP